MEKKSLNLNKNFDLGAQIKFLFNKRYLILGSAFFFLVLGVTYYFLSDRNYRVKIVVLPESSSSRTPNLAGVASLAGINLNTNAKYEDIPSGLYPQIVSSPPFLERLCETTIRIEGVEEPLSYRDYYTHYFEPSVLDLVYRYTIGLPGIVLGAVLGGDAEGMPLNKVDDSATNQIKSYTKLERSMMTELMKSITVNVNEQFGYVEIISELPDPDLSAQISEQTLLLLQGYVHEFKTKKATSQLNFLQDRYNIKRNEYDSIQDQLAHFKDENLRISKSTAKIELDRLQNEFALQAAVLQELAKNLETQKLEVAKQTPTFSIIQPPIMPISPERPSKVLIVFLSISMGLILSISFIYFREEYKRIKKYLIKIIER